MPQSSIILVRIIQRSLRQRLSEVRGGDPIAYTELSNFLVGHETRINNTKAVDLTRFGNVTPEVNQVSYERGTKRRDSIVRFAWPTITPPANAPIGSTREQFRSIDRHLLITTPRRRRQQHM